MTGSVIFLTVGHYSRQVTPISKHPFSCSNRYSRVRTPLTVDNLLSNMLFCGIKNIKLVTCRDGHNMKEIWNILKNIPVNYLDIMKFDLFVSTRTSLSSRNTNKGMVLTCHDCRLPLEMSSKVHNTEIVCDSWNTLDFVLLEKRTISIQVHFHHLQF